MVTITIFPLNISADFIFGFDSINVCQVLVDSGMTKPKSKSHSSTHLPCRRTLCFRRKLWIISCEEKFISLDTALQFKILAGTRAMCSSSSLTDKCLFVYENLSFFVFLHCYQQYFHCTRVYHTFYASSVMP